MFLQALRLWFLFVLELVAFDVLYAVSVTSSVSRWLHYPALSFSLSLTVALSLSLSLCTSFSRPFSLTLSLTVALTLSLSLPCPLSLTLSLYLHVYISLSTFLSLISFSLHLSLSLALYLSFSTSLSLSLSLHLTVKNIVKKKVCMIERERDEENPEVISVCLAEHKVQLEILFLALSLVHFIRIFKKKNDWCTQTNQPAYET